jgi:hypothetical protein
MRKYIHTTDGDVGSPGCHETCSERICELFSEIGIEFETISITDGRCVSILRNRRLSTAEYGFLARSFRKLHLLEDIKDYQL